MSMPIKKTNENFAIWMYISPLLFIFLFIDQEHTIGAAVQG